MRGYCLRKGDKTVLLTVFATVLRELQEHSPDIQFQFLSEYNK